MRFSSAVTWSRSHESLSSFCSNGKGIAGGVTMTAVVSGKGIKQE